MNDLVSCLLEAIAETERAAREPADYSHGLVWSSTAGGVLDTGEELVPIGDATLVHHIVRHDPSSVLRRCAADRKLIERDGPFCDCGQYGPPTNPHTGQPIPHHYDCSAYQAAQILAEGYGLEVDG